MYQVEWRVARTMLAPNKTTRGALDAITHRERTSLKAINSVTSTFVLCGEEPEKLFDVLLDLRLDRSKAIEADLQSRTAERKKNNK